MSTVFRDIAAALNTRLNRLAGAPPIAWENQGYAPHVGTAYIRPTLLPGDTRQATLGANGEDRTDGLYQVDVFVEAGRGTDAAVSIADTIADHFARGADMAYNDVIVTITRAQRRGGVQTADGWYMIPVEIYFKSHTAARA